MPAGTGQSIDVTRTQGTYYFVCKQAGHDKLGMRHEYVVK